MTQALQFRCGRLKLQEGMLVAKPDKGFLRIIQVRTLKLVSSMRRF